MHTVLECQAFGSPKSSSVGADCPCLRWTNDDIVGNIMSSSRLRKARRLLDELRRRTGAIKPKELERVARMIGREPDNTRGKEPTWDFPEDYLWSRALTIPRHGSRDLTVGTACNILNHLEADIAQLELLEAKEKANGTGQDGSNGAQGA